MPTEPPQADLSPRMRRLLELVHQVDGVAGARVWQWPGRVAVGVRATPLSLPHVVLRRVEQAVMALREDEEQWEFGLLEDI